MVQHAGQVFGYCRVLGPRRLASVSFDWAPGDFRPYAEAVISVNLIGCGLGIQEALMAQRSACRKRIHVESGILIAQSGVDLT